MRRMIGVSLLVLAGLVSSAVAGMTKQSAGGLEVNYANLVSRADLHYDKPVGRSEEGMPLGNGRMGSLVGTVPTALKLQINRVDVFATNCTSNAFPERHTDYCGGCAFVDLEFVDYGADVFPSDRTSQHLACYDGLVTVKGRDVEVRALAWHERDVMAFEVTDRRDRPNTIRINLRMLRPALVKTLGHVAKSRLDNRDGRIVLTQTFEEGGYYCGSAVAVGVWRGRPALATPGNMPTSVDRTAPQDVSKGETPSPRIKVRQTREEEMSLVVEPDKGSFTVLVSSAASFDKAGKIAEAAITSLDAVAIKGFVGLLESNKTWWHDFWSKSFVHLHSADGVADSLEQNYTYYLYVMASSSRGKYPTKFNGMLWTTGGDTRRWGGHYWGANQSCLYHALLPTNRLDLLDPMFDMYSAMYESCALAARQQWGSQGLYIPETVAFDGLARLPDDIAAEMRDLYLLRKPWEQRSEQFRTYAGTKLAFSSRWNWIGNGKWDNGRWVYTERGSGPYGPVTHIFSRGAKIAYLYWLRYEYTMDPAWLRDRAYPMLKGVAEFYRHYPNLKKEADGKYHIHHVNSNEPVWGGQDTDEELSSMYAILPVVIRAAEILNIDADLRPVWRELLDHLAPLPRSQGRSPTWVKALDPVAKGRASSLPDGNTMPMWFFDLCTLENVDPETMKIASATYGAYFRSGVNAKTRVGVLSKLGVTAAMMGRAEHVRYLLPNQINSQESAPLANRMDLREGQQTTSVQRLGRAADTLHNALCQSVPAAPGKEPVIRVFPAWPKEWDAAFTLLARGAFLVSSSMQGGKIEFVQVKSQAGGECRLRNPWREVTATLYHDGKKGEDLAGEILTFATCKGETIVVVPRGSTPAAVKVLSSEGRYCEGGQRDASETCDVCHHDPGSHPVLVGAGSYPAARPGTGAADVQAQPTSRADEGGPSR